jgi:hypothetical protein
MAACASIASIAARATMAAAAATRDEDYGLTNCDSIATNNYVVVVDQL